LRDGQRVQGLGSNYLLRKSVPVPEMAGKEHLPVLQGSAGWDAVAASSSFLLFFFVIQI
jgi:hypothetical protein